MMHVFISHASEDLALAQTVKAWLDAAGHETFLDNDLGTGIILGEQWRERLLFQLRKADAVVFLISDYFNASPWCSMEVAYADQLQCERLPVALQPGIEHPLLNRAHFQYTDYFPDPSQARIDLLNALNRHQITAAPRWLEGDNPYPGLRPFDRENANLFFGREDDLHELNARIRALCTPGGASLLAVQGISGCGKSSLLRVAVSQNPPGNTSWRATPTWEPRIDPRKSLADALATVAGPDRYDEFLSKLENDSYGLLRIAEEILRGGGGRFGRHLVIALDQAEQLTIGTDGTLHWFSEQLHNAAVDNGPVKAVVTIRSDFIDQLSAEPRLASIGIESFALAPIPAERLPVIVTRPAIQAGLHFEPHLVDDIVADTGSGQSLPLLAFALNELAEGLTRGGTMTFEKYRRLGGVQGALASRADAALAAAGEATGLRSDDVIAAVARLVRLELSGSRTARQIPLDALPHAQQEALRILSADPHRLLVVSAESREIAGQKLRRPTVGLAHEALLTSWKALDEFLTIRYALLRHAIEVEEAATAWAQSRDTSDLWTGHRLESALDAFPSRGVGPSAHSALDRASDWEQPVGISITAHEFLDASRRQVSRRRRIFRGLVSGFLVVVLVASAIVVWRQQVAVRAEHKAIQAQHLAASRAMNVLADSERDSDTRQALQLNVAALSLSDTAESRAALSETLTRSATASAPLKAGAGQVFTVAVSHNDRTLASVGSISNKGFICFWNVTTPGRPRRAGPVITQPTTVTTGVFNPSGDSFITGDADGLISFWDIRDPAHAIRVGTTLQLGTQVTALAFSRDSDELAVAYIKNNATMIRVWDVRNPARPIALTPEIPYPANTASLDFSSDGHSLAIGGSDGKVIFWNLTNPAKPQPWGTPISEGNWVYDVAYSPDGRTLATVNTNHQLSFWNVADPAHPKAIGKPLDNGSTLFSVTFAPDGKSVAVGTFSGTVIIWDLHNLSSPRSTILAGHSQSVMSVDYSADGNSLATGSTDGTALLWQLPNNVQPRVKSVFSNASLNAMTVSQDGRIVACAVGSQVLLWDVSDAEHPRRLGQASLDRAGSLISLAFSKDGRTLAAGATDHTAQLWDIGDRLHPRTLGMAGTPADASPDTYVSSVSLSPDGRTLATGSYDHTVQLWDLRDLSHPRPEGSSLIHGDPVAAVAFSPNGRVLASGDFDNLTTFNDVKDPAHPKALGSPISGHTAWVQAIAYSKTKNVLATGSSDATVRVWDVSDPSHPRSLGAPLTGSGGEINAVAISDDAQELALASSDDTVRIWDLSDRQHLRPFGYALSLPSNANSVAFDPRARILITGSTDGTVTLWDIKPLKRVREDGLKLACARLDAPLDANLWQRFAPGIIQQKTCHA